MTSRSISEGFAENAKSSALEKGRSFESAIESVGGMRWGYLSIYNLVPPIWFKVNGGIHLKIRTEKRLNNFGASASGSRTDDYLNPVVPENFTNAGTGGVFR